MTRLTALAFALTLTALAARAEVAPVQPDADIEDDAALLTQLIDDAAEAAALPAPANVTGTVAGPNLVDLAWQPVEGAASYVVEWSADGRAWGLLGSVESPVFTDRDVTPGASYQYRVTALDRDGHVSAPSAAVRVAVLAELAMN